MSVSGQRRPWAPRLRASGGVVACGFARLHEAPTLLRRVRVHATLHGFQEKDRELELPEGALADDAPRALDIRPELVLVFRGERPLPADEPLREGDHIRILRVVSGG